MDPKVKADASRRLSYAEGHLSGIKRMVDEEKYCVDILKQTYAVRRAIQKVRGSDPARALGDPRGGGCKGRS